LKLINKPAVGEKEFRAKSVRGSGIPGTPTRAALGRTHDVLRLPLGGL